jgi:hypothetical protein
VFQGSNPSCPFATWAGGAWSAIEPLEDRTPPLGTAGFERVHSGTDDAAGWTQQDPVDATVMRSTRAGF